MFMLVKGGFKRRIYEGGYMILRISRGRVVSEYRQCIKPIGKVLFSIRCDEVRGLRGGLTCVEFCRKLGLVDVNGVIRWLLLRESTMSRWNKGIKIYT